MSGAGNVVAGLRRALLRTRRLARHIMQPAVRKAAKLHALYEDLYWLRAGRARFREGWEPGHFYSPIPSLADVHRRDAEIFAVPDVVPGVDLNEAGQLYNLQKLAACCARQPYELTPQSRYSPDTRTSAWRKPSSFMGSFAASGPGASSKSAAATLQPPSWMPRTAWPQRLNAR